MVLFEEHDGDRLELFYRLTRHIGRCLGMISRDEPVVSLLNKDNNHFKLVSNQVYGADSLLRHSKEIRGVVRSSLRLPVIPRNEDDLAIYEQLYTYSSSALRITDPLSRDFSCDKWFRRAVPHTFELENYEYRLLKRIFDSVVDDGQLRAIDSLINEGFLPMEAQELVATSRLVMTVAVELDQETERKIQGERLERIASAANKDMDYRLELAAVKERSRLLGLTDRPPESTMQDIVSLIQESSDDDLYLPEASLDED